MKILQIIPVFSPVFGGPVSGTHLLAKELGRRHKVVVLATAATDRTHDATNQPLAVKRDNYLLVLFPRKFKVSNFDFSPSMLSTLARTMSEFDVVHVHSWRHFQDAMMPYLAGKSGTPFVLEAHGSVARAVAYRHLKLLYDSVVGRKVLEKASGVIALTAREVQDYVGLGVPRDKIDVVPNSVDPSEFASLPARGAFRETLGVRDEEKMVFFLGRIHKVKGLDSLLEAAAIAHSLYRLDHCRIVISGPDDGCLGQLKALQQSNEFLRAHVLFTGPLYESAKLQALVDSDLFVMPSIFETFPIALLEAFACSKPTIVSDAIRIPDLVVDTETAYVFRAGDTKQLARRLMQAIEDDETCIEMGRRARERLFARYTSEITARMLEACYAKTIERNRFN